MNSGYIRLALRIITLLKNPSSLSSFDVFSYRTIPKRPIFLILSSSFSANVPVNPKRYFVAIFLIHLDILLSFLIECASSTIRQSNPFLQIFSYCSKRDNNKGLFAIIISESLSSVLNLS